MVTKYLLELRILPRWVIIAIDISIVCFSTLLGYLLRFNFNFSYIDEFKPALGISVNAVACLLSLLVTKSYAGIVRYTGLKDGLRVFQTLILTHLMTTVFNLVYHYNTDKNIIPYSVVLISFLASFVLLFQYRLLIKNIFSYYGRLYSEKTNVAVFGAGQMGLVTKHLLDDDHRSNYSAIAFFEDDPNKIGKEINGTSIFSFSKLESVINKLSIEEVIIAVNKLSVRRKNEIVDACLSYNLKVRTVPNLNSWVQGELSINQIKQVRIEDLLERDSINLKNEAVESHLRGKVICITGAAGSIGSELVRQVLNYNPKKIVLIDQAESPLYELINSLTDTSSLEVYIADILNEKRIDYIFEDNKPDIVYHAAAYKHVPLMESNVFEALDCNVKGTKILSQLAVKHGVQKFVMVSTDKAVNPTSVMGASKRIAEMFVQSLNKEVKTAFVTTRFGNVLGSNGSVIPHFKRQIELGGPVTVTHPEITRYFMTIAEACELIIEAGCMGRGGEIFLFDMGESVKIVDLARKMIRLSGFEPNEDIDIIYTGLRDGEKLYEELLANKENTLPTHNAKILIADVSVPDHNEVKESVDKIINTINQGDSEFSAVSIMKEIVPEFKSNRSLFEVLDN